MLLAVHLTASSFLLLVVGHFATSSVLATSSLKVHATLSPPVQG